MNEDEIVAWITARAEDFTAYRRPAPSGKVTLLYLRHKVFPESGFVVCEEDAYLVASAFFGTEAETTNVKDVGEYQELTQAQVQTLTAAFPNL